MANTFRLEVVTPTGIVLDDQVVHVRCPGSAGDFGVLAGHAAMMAGLTAGRLSVDYENRSEDYAITGGYLEVHENNAVVLAESCINKQDIDLEEARRELAEAQAALDKADSSADLAIARAEFARARAKVSVAEFKREK